MVALKSLFVVLALGAEALAVSIPTCSTILGTKTVKNVPTSTTTVAKHITIIRKVILKVNVVVVPAPKTTTVRITETDTVVTTADQQTDTAWDTVTSESTTFITRTIWTDTTSVSSTTTTKFITSTVPAPASFTAIQDDPLYEARKRAIEDGNIGNDIQAAGGELPQSVGCIKEIPSYTTKTISTTVQGPRRTLKGATKTKVVTVSTTSVSTEYPANAKTTSTTTAYPTTTVVTDVTSTSTIFQTVTVEIQTPSATEYAICASSNIISGANGGGLISSVSLSTTSYYRSLAGYGLSAVQCCQVCAARSWCYGSYIQPTSPSSCYAYLASDGSICTDGRQRNLANYFTKQTSPAGSLILSNGPCGQWKNGGSST
ncbi:hypothetical protein DER45DRAFT_618757 [Fusarium avenaceum]|nr:hypothetical protein DER45DRAFT_618757 [Fusarium avenaceum]